MPTGAYPEKSRLKNLMPVALWMLVFTALWLVLTTQLYLTVVPRGLNWSLGFVAYTQFLRVAIWMVLTPVVLAIYRRLPLQGRHAMRAFVVHLLLSIGAMFVNYLLRLGIDEVTGQSERGTQAFSTYAVLLFNGRNFADIFIYWAIIGTRHVHELYQRERAAEVAQAQLAAQLVEAEMRALKQQLKPHFIYNSLNAIAALVREEKYPQAVDTLARLSGLMRTLSDASGRDEVVLEEEITFVERLLYIEQVRFGDKLRVEIAASPECRRALVPNLLLQPLVDNAIKHGISRRVKPGRIIVRAAVERGDRLRIEVLNDGMPPGPAAEPMLVRGVGLGATQSRLERMYGADFSFRFDLEREEGANVVIVLPLRFAPALPDSSSPKIP